ncbi:3-keto-disaccharide hydrolase [Caulifigura coniformis]|nr:DUF1080 domain-containing protein [Caulifigura coniformis]
MPRLTRRTCFTSAAMLIAVTGLYAQSREWKSGVNWPEPKIVTPGEGVAPPSDAIVLFDGKSLDAWKGADGWVVKDGYASPTKGDIATKQEFSDCQLHIEFATPEAVKGDGQGRGNSGVFLCGEFEVQVLDSYENKTYFDGQCGGIYKQRPPLVNACRKPGEWQSYDIIFHAPQFHDDGELKRPATITVLQNNVLVQDHLELLGDTPYVRAPRYNPEVTKGPIKLQNHGNPVKFRNIWIRELGAPQI